MTIPRPPRTPRGGRVSRSGAPARLRGGKILAAAGTALWPGLAAAEPPALSIPIDCVLGETCHIQSYFDRDPGPGFADFTCGPLGYDGHRGTDFALPTHAAMREGVDVLAAAPGVVVGLRDGVPDIDVNDPAAPDPEGRECGNGVAVDHGGGWSTQYCHLALGSIAVGLGDEVEAGDALGRVGMSGFTEFPHLHLTVFRGEERVDPFDVDGGACGAEERSSIWAEPLDYVPTGLIGAGVLDHVPEFAALEAGAPAGHPGTPDAPLVLWGHAFGGAPGDVMRFVLEGPGGAVVEAESAVSRGQAVYFLAQGRRAPPEGWAPGDYAGRVVLTRGGEVVGERPVEVRIE